MSLCAVLFPMRVFDGTWDLIGSVSGGFPTYFSIKAPKLGLSSILLLLDRLHGLSMFADKAKLYGVIYI